MLTVKIINDFLEQEWNKPRPQPLFILPPNLYDSLEKKLTSDKDKELFRAYYAKPSY